MGEFRGNQHEVPDEYDHEYSYEQLVEDVGALAEQLGEPPTTRDAQADDRFPSLNTIYQCIEDDWATVLEDAGLEPVARQIGAYDTDDRASMATDLQRVFEAVPSDHLTMRQYDDRGSYATSTLKKHFGSWDEACTAAGIDAGTKHGVHCTGPQGNTLDSWRERTVATFLHEHGIEYETHPSVDGTDYSADFYLPAADLWIEVDGYVEGNRPNEEEFELKLEHFRSNDMDHAVVEGSDELAAELERRGVVPEG